MTRTRKHKWIFVVYFAFETTVFRLLFLVSGILGLQSNIFFHKLYNEKLPHWEKQVYHTSLIIVLKWCCYIPLQTEPKWWVNNIIYGERLQIQTVQNSQNLLWHIKKRLCVHVSVIDDYNAFYPEYVDLSGSDIHHWKLKMNVPFQTRCCSDCLPHQPPHVVRFTLTHFYNTFSLHSASFFSYLLSPSLTVRNSSGLVGYKLERRGQKEK